ncbi:MAG: methyltransferase [Crocinitomicaceae bacterium]|nr:methyltransferase [Crocinitomicaceae bacterium]
MTFKFKHFEIQQDVNAHKVGTDSMLLGALAKGNFSRILDIGTGTGVLALMAAQNHPGATITAIEPDLPSFEEGKSNFEKSSFSDRIHPVNSTLQYFGSMERFDLIISNPPYFLNSSLSEDPDRNRARHANDLPIYELYECVADLLAEDGEFHVIIPYDLETPHVKRAFDNDLYVKKVVHLMSPNGSVKRSILVFSELEVDPEITEFQIRDDQGNYTAEYKELTKEFHGVEL